MKICNSESEFITAVTPSAQKAGKRYNMLPSILIAQSALELGYAIPDYWDNESIADLLKYNNMVGQKKELLSSTWYDKSVWPGKSFEKKTPEYYSGKKVTITDSFRIFDDIEQSYCDYILFLLYGSLEGYNGKPKYGKKVVEIKDPELLIKTINSKGYATDVNYYKSVMRIVKKHNLTKYDDVSKVEASMYVPESLKEEYGLTGTKETTKKEERKVETKTAKGKKVMIDAGHYGYYNQSPAIKEYWESKMTWKLHLMLKEELEKYGIIVGTTRKNQETDMALYDRGYASKGYDLFISVHSNAVGDNVNEKVDYPVCFVQISGKSDKIGTLLSECVQRVMGTSQPADHWSQQGQHGDYYGVLRGATAAGTVGVIVEHSFHTQTRATKWLLKEENLRKLAVAEARVINDYLAGVPSSSGPKYIQRGSKGSDVEELQSMLIACGYSCGSYGADGSFGGATYEALTGFQGDHGITPNGIYDDATKAALTAAYKATKDSEKKKSSKKKKTATKKFMIGDLDYSPVFDPEYYRKHNPDLQRAFGDDVDKLWNHMRVFGLKEGRQASANFNPQNYRARYADLREAFGYNWPAYYEHWLRFGSTPEENRNGK